MTDELEHMLRSACPTIFSGDTISVGGGHGWFDLIMECSLKLEALNVTLPEDERFTVAQIKEKFGGLRYYLDGKPNEQAYAIIQEAENKADKTCAQCGSEKNVHTRSDRWVYTICDACEMLKNVLE